MHRINLYVTESQNKWLEEQSKENEVGKSEVMRNVIDNARKRRELNAKKDINKK